MRSRSRLQPREPCELFRRDTLIAQLQLKIGNQRNQVHIAAALAIAVDRTLHLYNAFPRPQAIDAVRAAVLSCQLPGATAVR